MNFTASILPSELVALRRQFHKHAESGLSEFWTSACLAKELTAAGYQVKYGDEVQDRDALLGLPDEQTQARRKAVALEQGADPEWVQKQNGLTALVVDVRPDLAPHTALRFDFDAVDVEESTDTDHKPTAEGFASINPGQFHACGHDGHATIGLAVAKELLRYKDQLRHNIRILFEPAEEGGRGATPMVKAGVVNGIKYFFAAHIGAYAQKDHQLICGTKGLLATTKFDVEFFGKAAHAGSDPHKGKNSLLAAASMMMNLHAIPRNGEGATRITVGKIESGTGRNVIPSYAKLICETRGSSTEINEYMFEKVKLIVENTAAMYEQQYKLTIMGGAGCTDSDQKIIDVVRAVGEQIPYFHNELITDVERGLGTDDVCTFIEAIQKQGGFGSYAQIGSKLEAGHHNQRFDFNEDLLAPSVELFCRVALQLDTMD